MSPASGDPAPSGTQTMSAMPEENRDAGAWQDTGVDTGIGAGVAARIAALTDGETDVVALMASVACELHHSDPRFDWTGFYRVTAPGVLKIGPYQGGHGCLVIPFARGVCGAAARSGEVQIVGDVAAFPGHIACSASTRSEIVLPVRDRAGRILGVLDIDSDRPNAFGQADAVALEQILGQVFGRL